MIERGTVDVSVALKWALDDEEGLTEALALRDEMVVHRVERYVQARGWDVTARWRSRGRSWGQGRHRGSGSRRSARSISRLTR